MAPKWITALAKYSCDDEALVLPPWLNVLSRSILLLPLADVSSASASLLGLVSVCSLPAPSRSGGLLNVTLPLCLIVLTPITSSSSERGRCLEHLMELYFNKQIVRSARADAILRWSIGTGRYLIAFSQMLLAIHLHGALLGASFSAAEEASLAATVLPLFSAPRAPAHADKRETRFLQALLRAPPGSPEEQLMVYLWSCVLRPLANKVRCHFPALD